MVAFEDACPYPCVAEDGNDDGDADEFHADHDASMHKNDSTILCNKQIELKHEVSMEQSCHACHLRTTNTI